MFKKDFIFGAATASYQIEGSISKDGKCESIWDEFVKNKEHILDGSDGSVVCDSYIKYKDDVKLLKGLNIKSYRFSISWPRVITEDNKPNLKGLNYYKKLCNYVKRHQVI